MMACSTKINLPKIKDNLVEFILRYSGGREGEREQIIE